MLNEIERTYRKADERVKASLSQTDIQRAVEAERQPKPGTEHEHNRTTKTRDRDQLV